MYKKLGWIPHACEFVAFVTQSRVGIKDAIFIFSPRPLRPHHYLRDSYQSVLLRLLCPPPQPSALLVLDQQLRFDIHVAAWLRCKGEAGVSQVILPLSLSPVSLLPPPPSLLLPPLPPVSWCQHCLESLTKGRRGFSFCFSSSSHQTSWRHHSFFLLWGTFVAVAFSYFCPS